MALAYCTNIRLACTTSSPVAPGCQNSVVQASCVGSFANVWSISGTMLMGGLLVVRILSQELNCAWLFRVAKRVGGTNADRSDADGEDGRADHFSLVAKLVTNGRFRVHITRDKGRLAKAEAAVINPPVYKKDKDADPLPTFARPNNP